MNMERMDATVSVLKEMSNSYVDLLQAVKGTIKDVKTARKLWRNGNKSKLVKLGLALIVFPEPTPISETIGICLIAAEAVQKGVRSRAIYIEDVYKTFQDTFKDLRTTKYDLQI